MNSKAEKLMLLEKQFLSLISTDIPWESALVSLVALIKQHLDYVSWVGFYRAKGETLWVGPYQGNLACLEIPPGKGVCGAAFQQKKTIIVADVHQFQGHIACDSLSQSEIVLPVMKNGACVGVLDLDSHQPSAFDEVDKAIIEGMLARLDQQKN